MPQLTSENWFETPLGRAWLDREQSAAGPLLEKVFGFEAVSVEQGWPGQPLLEYCSIRMRQTLAPGGNQPDFGHDPAARIPCDAGSVDAVILPHTLEFVASPHQLLRESERILAGEGHILITGFNPWSAWSVRRIGRRTRFPEAGRPVAENRLRDWLALLGLEVVACRRYFRRPPVDHDRLLEKTQRLDTLPWMPWPQCGYALLARKHLYALTPLRPAWQKRRKQPGGLIEPAARNISSRNLQ